MILIALLSYWNIDCIYSQLASMSGTVTMPTAGNIDNCPTGQGCCGGALALSGVDLAITNLSTNIVTSTVTNPSGQFLENLPTAEYQIVPSYLEDGPWTQGVTTLDIYHLNLHIERIRPIVCPFGRLAGDVDNNGKLNESDLKITRDLILARIRRYNQVPNWRFIAKAYTTGHEHQPDFNFVGNFWKIDYLDNQNQELPFGRNYQDSNNDIYTYNNPNSKWMHILNRQALTDFDPCEQSFWGFDGVKSGDVNASAITISTASLRNGTNELTGLDYKYEFIHADGSSNTDEIRLSPGKKYVIEIAASLPAIVQAYQLGLKVDREGLNVVQLKNNPRLGGNLEEDYAFLDNELRTLWLSPELEEGRAMREATTLFSMEIAPRRAIEDLQQHLVFDNGILGNVFYANQAAIERGIIYISVKEIN